MHTGKKYLEITYFNEKVTALANKVSIKRSNIIVWNRKRNSRLILDPTIEFEKCKIYINQHYINLQDYYCSKQNFLI